jgi:hypothetical protein
MPHEVHVTTSQADAAKMIVERNSANGKPTPDAIRKIAEAEADPAHETTNPGRPEVVESSRRNGRLRAFLARMLSGRATTRGADLKR